MKRLDFLLEQARLQTENEEFSDTTGISDQELIQYANDAQVRILSLIVSTHPTVFVKEASLGNVTAFQELYDLPDDVFLENRITSVEYSDTGQTRDYFKLEPATMLLREAGAEGFPTNYIRRSGKILLHPKPTSSTGILRVNYVRRIADVDLRRGRVESVTVDDTTNKVTALTIDVAQSDYDSDELIKQDFLCAISRTGEQKMHGIILDSIDANTGIVTIDSSFVFDEGETIAVGDYITTGLNSSTHSELPKVCERYLIAYVAWKILKKDSSEDAAEQQQEIAGMETDILNSFGDTTDDIIFVPIIDED